MHELWAVMSFSSSGVVTRTDTMSDFLE